MENASAITGKLIGTLFLLVFAIGFSWFGFAMGLSTMNSMLGQWYQARSYIAVPAQVHSAELESSRSEGEDTQRVHAKFSYRYQNRDYLGGKVSTSPLADNLDDYHQRVHARLEEARSTGAAVMLWVDPVHPERAFYDRSLRWKPLLFMVPFAVLFPAVGVGAWVMIGFLWLSRSGTARPGKLRGQSSPGRLAPLTMSFFAFFWNTISWPIAILALVARQDGLEPPRLLVLLFPAVGLALIWMVWRMWRTRWRIGRPMLEVLQGGAATGRFPLRGRIHFSPGFAMRLSPTQPSHRLQITVKLQQTVGSGEDATVTSLGDACVYDATLARGATSVDFSGAVPLAMRDARPAEQARLEWKLELKALGAELLFDLDPVEINPAAGPAAS